MKKFAWCLCLAALVSSLTLAGGNLDRAVGLLDLEGTTAVLPEIGYGNADGAGSDALVVSEPKPLRFFRAALEEDPQLEQSDDVGVRRLLNLRASWQAKSRSVAFRQALGELKAKAQQIAAKSGRPVSETSVSVLGGDATLLRKLTIPENGTHQQQLQQVVADITCFDNNYHVSQADWGNVWCSRGGDGCSVEVDCGNLGGISIGLRP